MGNRAVIKFKNSDAGIYLHWNGRRDSVEAFLDYCMLRGFRDGNYGVARMAQIIGNYFGGDLSIGVISTENCPFADLNPGDNGVYVVENWQIVERYPLNITEQDDYDRLTMLLDINHAQPEKDRISDCQIHSFVAEHRTH